MIRCPACMDYSLEVPYKEDVLFTTRMLWRYLAVFPFIADLARNLSVGFDVCACTLYKCSKCGVYAIECPKCKQTISLGYSYPYPFGFLIRCPTCSSKLTLEDPSDRAKKYIE